MLLIGHTLAEYILFMLFNEPLTDTLYAISSIKVIQSIIFVDTTIICICSSYSMCRVTPCNTETYLSRGCKEREKLLLQAYIL